MSKKSFCLLLLIFSLAVVLRFYRLGEVPVGFYRDEAFLGYNAYSILQTGKDMSGSFLPFHLESFLYSPAGYSYFAIPSIIAFDLNSFSVRFPAALFGALTIPAAFFLTKELFHKNSLALLAAGLLTINPWHINLSRTATENVPVVFFITLGTWLFILWTKKEKLFFLASSFLCFGLTLLVYQAPRAFLPFFIPLLILIFIKEKMRNKKLLLGLSMFLLIVILPLVFILSSDNLSLRIRTVSIFATEETRLTTDEQIREDGVSSISPLISRAFHNKLIGYSSQFIGNYFSHFSFDFLFEDKGLPIRYKIPNSGLLYLFELPLILMGIFALSRKYTQEGLFLLGWIFIAPIGSALTFDDVPNLQRTLLVFPALSIISATGAYELFRFLNQNRKFLMLGYLLSSMAVLYVFFFYLHQYYIHQLVHRPWYRHEGYKELVNKVNRLLPKYEKAIITNRESAPTIFFLFYGKYNPVNFQEETRNTPIKDFDRIDFGQYKFSEEECPLREVRDGNGEIIGITGEIGMLYVNYGICKTSQSNVRVLDEIKRSDGSLVFRILKLTGEK